MADKHSEKCRVCKYGVEMLDWNLSNVAIGQIVDCAESSVRRHRKWVEANGFESVQDSYSEDAEDRPEWVANSGVPRRAWQLPDGTWRQSYQNAPGNDADENVPAWPVIDRPAPVKISSSASPALIRDWKTAVAGADSQIGFRHLEDGSYDPFHDDSALKLFNTLVEIERPDSVVLAGDIIDLPEQGRFAQELSFAGTTQKAIDRTYVWLADIREKTGGSIEFIEGNHDKRLQNFVEANAMSAFGLRRADWPDAWPVMSLPYLLRLDELDVNYYDSYPNAHVWLNDTLRAEHGTKANAKGSTAQKYLDETPHISRIIGHSHRQEIIQRTTWDRIGKIRSQVINPGALCRVDGAVPSFHGSTGPGGKPATVYEDWQQGAAIIRYTDDKVFSELVQFDDGEMVYQGTVYSG